ncbi:TIGR04104 family putative zinc finger protein [Indiicoccus explosivorum]|uniref:TIGR04104 family putative zinc finger protein n=1 Tax=Indiicoccus explosivorum TaxID=1917864 RepID=UPI001390339C|nr:TIGR04104 family putative zinc finger protein [Indiicoccus explosivorum]
MPACQHCHYKWTWRETAGIGFKGHRNCPNCGNRQYLVPQFGKGTAALYLIPLFLILFSRPLFGASDFVFFALVALLLTAQIILFPFTVRLSNKQEPLW